MTNVFLQGLQEIRKVPKNDSVGISAVIFRGADDWFSYFVDHDWQADEGKWFGGVWYTLTDSWWISKSVFLCFR